MGNTGIYILLIINMILLAVLVLIVVRGERNRDEEVEKAEEAAIEGVKEATSLEIARMESGLRDEIAVNQRNTVQYIGSSVKNLGDIMMENQKAVSGIQDAKLENINRQFMKNSLENEQKLENIRQTVSEQLNMMSKENSRQIEIMRETVDEKLQKTLNDRISLSFRTVNERLEEVYKGLGEMQTLAAGVGDLKKVLTNVKTRGILGEIQLGSILEEILSKEQYEENVRTKSTGSNRVEFAVKFPGGSLSRGGTSYAGGAGTGNAGYDGTVYLPIDSKFPGDTYSALMDAYESGDKVRIDIAGRELEKTVKKSAKDIRDKYVEPPYTTDFAIMFLPFEGLYAEVVRRGLIEVLQRDYRITVAGPTTMAALLNSLQMGFRTLAIEKHSDEVWQVLGAVKTEFDNFEDILEKARLKIDQANSELDRLVGVRTRQIQRKLSDVTKLDGDTARRIIDGED